MAIKGIYRGLLYGALHPSDDPNSYVPKVVIYGKLEVQTVDMTGIFASNATKTKWKKYYINGHTVEPKSVQRVKYIPEDYVDPFEK